MKGASITVVRRTPKTVTVGNVQQIVHDRFGNVEYTTKNETVNDVLISPGATSDMEASRPEGVTVAYTLHFPKTYTGTLEGCDVILPAPWAGTYHIIGDPREYMDENTPTRWHMPVEVEAAHG